MTHPDYIEEAIARSYRLASIMEALSLAVDGEQILNKPLSERGGQEVIDMAAELALELVDLLETGHREANAETVPEGA